MKDKFKDVFKKNIGYYRYQKMVIEKTTYFSSISKYIDFFLNIYN